MEKEYPNGIPQCGTDALRFTLVQYTQQGKQINLDVQRAVANRYFCNKIWQATRFAMMHFEKSRYNAQDYSLDSLKLAFDKIEHAPSNLYNQWILSKLSTTIEKVRSSMEQYMFSEAVTSLYQFFLYDYCDVYVELVKPILYANDDNAALAPIKVTIVLRRKVFFFKQFHIEGYTGLYSRMLRHFIPSNASIYAIYY